MKKKWQTGKCSAWSSKRKEAGNQVESCGDRCVKLHTEKEWNASESPLGGRIMINLYFLFPIFLFVPKFVKSSQLYSCNNNNKSPSLTPKYTNKHLPVFGWGNQGGQGVCLLPTKSGPFTKVPLTCPRLRSPEDAGGRQSRVSASRFGSCLLGEQSVFVASSVGRWGKRSAHPSF